MPRAVDPPGRFPTADMDPAQRADQTLNIATFPGFDWFKWLIEQLRAIIHAIITFLIDMIAFFTNGLIDLSPIHEIIDEIIDSIIADLGTGENLLKLWRLIVSIIETATGVNLTRVLIDLLPMLIDLMNHLGEMAEASGTVVYELVMVPIRILQQIQRIFSGQPVDLSAIPEVFQPIVTALTQWWAVIGVNLPGAIDQAAQALWYIAELIYGVGVNSIQGLIKLINDLWTMLQQIANIFTGQPVLDPINNIVGQFNTWWANVGGGLPDLGAGLRNAIEAAGVNLNQSLADAGTQLGQAVNAASDAVWTMIEGAGVDINQSLADASAALGAAITGAQDAVWSIIEGAGINIDQTLTVASEILGTAISNAQELGQGVVDALNNAAKGLEQGVGAALSTAQANLNNLFNAIPNFLAGLTGTHYGQQGMNEALEAQRISNIRRAEQISAMQSDLAAIFNVNPIGGGTVSEVIDFVMLGGELRAPQSGMDAIMLPGLTSGPATMGIAEGLGAAWEAGDGDDIQLFPVETESDYQVMTVALGALNDLLTTVGGSPVLELNLLLRANAARNTFTFLRLRSTGTQAVATLMRSVNGAVSALQSGLGVVAQSAPITSLTAGSKIRVIAGDPSSQSPYAFQVLHNDSPILTFSGDLSPLVGSGFRYLGLQMRVYRAGAQWLWGPVGPGGYSFPIPHWANAIDGVLLGGAGGGQGCGALYGEAGWAGGWQSFVLQRGIDIPWDTTQITGNVGGGGAGGGGFGGVGSGGGATTANAAGMASRIASGGAGGSNGTGTNSSSRSPNPLDLVLNGVTYNSGGSGRSGAGSLVVFTQAGSGTGGRAWYRAYNPIDLFPPNVTFVTYQDNAPPPATYPFVNLPEPGVKGRVYLPSDVGVLLRDNGEAWERFMGGPLGYFTAPPRDGWTANSMPAGASFIDDLDGKLFTSQPGTQQWAFQTRPYPSTNFALTAYLETDYLSPSGVPGVAGVGAQATLVISDGTQLISFGPAVVNVAAAGAWVAGTGHYVASQHWASSTAFTVDYFGNHLSLLWLGEIPRWYRIVDDGFNRVFQVSKNGTEFRTCLTALRTDRFTPTRIGVGVIPGLATFPIRLRLRSWHGVP